MSKLTETKRLEQKSNASRHPESVESREGELPVTGSIHGPAEQGERGVGAKQNLEIEPLYLVRGELEIAAIGLIEDFGLGLIDEVALEASRAHERALHVLRPAGRAGAASTNI